jgi:dipeptidyl aminopeptidase/acylaminoacyl peptidase
VKQPEKEKGGKRPPLPGVPLTPPPAPTSGELVLRNLADGTERIFADVGDYSFSRDGKTLVYTVAGTKKESTPGVFAVTPGQSAPPLVLRSGPGKYSRLTWDEEQTQLAFFHTPPPGTPALGTPPAKSLPKKPPVILHWKRGKATDPMPTETGITAVGRAVPQAVELVAEKPQWQPKWQISEAGGLSWSVDGKRLFFGLVPPPAPAAKADPNKPVVELWHYRDDFIQPMQKVRYGQTSTKTYRAVFHLEDKTSRQLSDETLPEVSPAPRGEYALALDDRAYRRLVGGAESAQRGDAYLLNTRTGEKKPLAKRISGASWSPGGKYVLRWDGKHWHAHDSATGKARNLTAKLGVSFGDERFDMPNEVPAYGIAGWTADDESVLLYDRYDIWRIVLASGETSNLTLGTGRKEKLGYRAVRLDPRARTIDLSKPVLLRVEQEPTNDTGFYTLTAGEAPKRLVFGPRAYNLLSFKKDTHLLSVSTFADYPDLHVADREFREIKKLSNLGEQTKKYVWGKAELVRYKNADGVALEGVLLKPENFDPTKKYPMMVYIYERLSQNLHRFVEPRPGTSINPSYYVSNGYLVFMPDIIYTVGYPGQSAQKCVLPAIEKVVEMGGVDEKAIGIQGHSWGGYQTAYLITQTSRFKAASAGAPVTNMTSAYGGIRWGTGLPRQFQYERTQSRIGGNLWEYPTRFIENSPVFMADRVKTPLLMLHNDKDEAVPWQEGIQYYLALRRLDKEVYLFNYVGEAHGLRQRKNQQDYTVRLQQFFDHHLKGAAKPEWMTKGEPYAPAPGTRPPTPMGGEGEGEE